MTEMGLPAVEAQIPREDRAALFPYGYGLSLDESKSDHMGIDASGFELTERRLPAAMPLMVAQLQKIKSYLVVWLTTNSKCTFRATQTVGRESRPAVVLAPLFLVSAPTPLITSISRMVWGEFDGSGPSQLYLGLDGELC